MKFGCLLSRNHRKAGLLDLLRVPHPSFAVNSTTPLDFRASGLSGAGLVLICCKVGFENNLEKLQEGGVSPHANAGRHVPPVRNVSAYGCVRDLSGIQDGEEWDS